MPHNTQPDDIQPTYHILHNGTAIKCLICQRISYYLEDVAHKYCGHCHHFHSTSAPTPP